MSESDGIDDVLDGGMRQSLMIASRIAETLARRRQETQRQQEHQDAQAAHEAQARLAADRSAAQAALAPVEKDQWWDRVQPNDIATAYAVSEGWKDHDPTALAASEKIRHEVLTRYGIDTHDVGDDAAYLESGIQTINSGRAGAQASTSASTLDQDDHQTQLTQATAWAAEQDPTYLAAWKQRKDFADTVDAERSAERDLIRHWQSATDTAPQPATAGPVPAQGQDDHQTQLAQASAWTAEHRPEFFADWKQRHGFADTVHDERRDERRLIQQWHAATIGQEETRKAAAEHEKAMQLLAAARAEELRAQAQKLAPEMERHQVPVEYLANPELSQALQRAHNAKTPRAVAAADVEIKERMFLIGKDGINGPDLDQLRQETTASVNGVGDSHFQDPGFVKAAKEMHEARLLAEGGFEGSQWTSVEQRYERAERELFARLEGVGREIEMRVTGNDSSRLEDQGLTAGSISTADYGSAERQEAFAASLATTGADETQVRGRAAAERSEGTHPSGAVTMGKGAAKARKTRPGAAVGAERSRSGPSK